MPFFPLEACVLRGTHRDLGGFATEYKKGRTSFHHDNSAYLMGLKQSDSVPSC